MTRIRHQHPPQTKPLRVNEESVPAKPKPCDRKPAVDLSRDVFEAMNHGQVRVVLDPSQLPEQMRPGGTMAPGGADYERLMAQVNEAIRNAPHVQTLGPQTVEPSPNNTRPDFQTGLSEVKPSSVGSALWAALLAAAHLPQVAPKPAPSSAAAPGQPAPQGSTQGPNSLPYSRTELAMWSILHPGEPRPDAAPQPAQCPPSNQGIALVPPEPVRTEEPQPIREPGPIPELL